MQKLIGIFVLFALVIFATPVHAETVQTCTESSSGYGSGSVCGAYTVKQHEVVAAGANDKELISIIVGAGVAGCLFFGAYKLTYRWYILD